MINLGQSRESQVQFLDCQAIATDSHCLSRSVISMVAITLPMQSR